MPATTRGLVYTTPGAPMSRPKKNKPTATKLTATKPTATKKKKAATKKISCAKMPSPAAIKTAAVKKAASEVITPKKPPTGYVSGFGVNVVSPADPIEEALLNFNNHNVHMAYAGSTKHTPAHDKKRKKMCDEYIHLVTTSMKDLIGEKLCKMVASDFGDKVMIPEIFNTCAGEVTLPKRKLVSFTVFTWMEGRVPQRGPATTLQPCSMMTMLRTFFGHMKDVYDWRYNLDKDFNFESGLIACLNRLFSLRRASEGQDYGAGTKRAILGHQSMKDLDMSVFNENDPSQHTQKVLVGFGGYMGFRGASEHTLLENSNIEKELFEAGHPMEGEYYYGIVNMADKTNRLSTNNHTLRNSVNARIPATSEAGGCLSRYLEKLGPGQTRLYCRPASTSQMKNYAHLRRPKAVFSSHQPLGKNTIRELMNDACTKLGYPTATGHGFRRLFITTLANDPNVNIEESMKSARHSSVSAHRAYVTTDGNSEVAKFKALGLVKN